MTDKDLQKLTEYYKDAGLTADALKALEALERSTTLPTKPKPALSSELEKVLSMERITPTEWNKLTPKDRQTAMEIFGEGYNSGGGGRAKAIAQFADVLNPDQKNDLWEINHCNIIGAIHNLLNEEHRMPSKTEIAQEVGLSRQTVIKHLKEYKGSALHLERKTQYEAMQEIVLDKMLRMAIQGDVRAARLYLEATGGLNPKGQPTAETTNNTLIQNQNNYIQINGTVLNQEAVKQLSTEHLNKIESILKEALG